jgi:hypothetical protein
MNKKVLFRQKSFTLKNDGMFLEGIDSREEAPCNLTTLIEITLNETSIGYSKILYK